jgi:hypothetical protein
MAEMNWVARRLAFENDLPTYWGRLCTDMEDAVKTYRVYAEAQGATMKVTRKDDRFRVDFLPSDLTLDSRSIEVQLDRKAWCVTARVDGAETKRIRFTVMGDGRAQVRDAAGEVMIHDQVSEELLKDFLFPA